jgi:hypothetical protein
MTQAGALDQQDKALLTGTAHPSQGTPAAGDKRDDQIAFGIQEAVPSQVMEMGQIMPETFTATIAKYLL